MTSAQSEGSEQAPLVSVVLMAYKRIEYLRITMASILGQTLGDFELIVADNSNSPEIARMCTVFDDPRIHYIGREPSLSMVQNAKSGMKLAKGKYIANIHDDDVLDARFLETLIHPMEQDEKMGSFSVITKLSMQMGWKMWPYPTKIRGDGVGRV